MSYSSPISRMSDFVAQNTDKAYTSGEVFSDFIDYFSNNLVGFTLERVNNGILETPRLSKSLRAFLEDLFRHFVQGFYGDLDVEWCPFEKTYIYTDKQTQQEVNEFVEKVMQYAFEPYTK